LNKTDVSQAKNKDLVGSLAAMKRAARTAREIAVRTDTAVITYRPGQGIVRVTAEELRKAGYK
jgi:hypothetical protein